MSDKPATPGFVYVLSHPAWRKLGPDGAVKIGKTGQDPSKRASKIGSASGLLVRPTVEWCARVADCSAVESAVHRHLDRYRLRKRRELFAVSVATARAAIEASATTVRTIPVRQPAPRVRRRRWNRMRLRLGAMLILSAALLAFRYFR